MEITAFLQQANPFFVLRAPYWHMGPWLLSWLSPRLPQAPCQGEQDTALPIPPPKVHDSSCPTPHGDLSECMLQPLTTCGDVINWGRLAWSSQGSGCNTLVSLQHAFTFHPWQTDICSDAWGHLALSSFPLDFRATKTSRKAKMATNHNKSTIPEKLTWGWERVSHSPKQTKNLFY